jgi:hypothetical protein
MRSIAFVVAALFLSSCGIVQTAPQRGTASMNTETILPVPAGRGADATAGVVVAYEFTGDGAIKDGTCRWRMINQDSKKSFFLTLQAGQASAYAPLEPGTYKSAKLGCGLAKVWDLEDTFAEGFKVQSGSASYLGKISFVFEAGDLTEVKKASRSDSADAFASASDTVPSGMPVVSAFTLAPIDRGIAAESAGGRGFDIKAQGLQGPILDELALQLKGCGASDRDTLRMGKLDYVAAYKGGKFLEWKSQKDSGSFSTELRQCVTDTMTGFLPDQKGAIEIRVGY